LITGTRYRALAEINRQSKLSAEIARAQTDISSGVRIRQASDDPIAASRIAEIRRAQGDQAVWSRNIQTAKSVAAEVDQQMTNIGDIFNRVKELTLAGSTDSASPSDRQAIVLELSSLRTSLANIAMATSPTGQPLFPTDAPLQISTSLTQRLSATAQRSDVFEGLSLVSGTGTLDDVIEAAADAIGNNNMTTRRALANVALIDVNTALNRVTDERAAQGVRAAQFDTAENSVIDAQTQLAEERSSLEDTDVAATIMRLNAKTLSLQAAQSAFAKVNRNTLFDFLG
jgi:flagellar hook-associated protein 3 FlgL